jgi:hypothetical protein
VRSTDNKAPGYVVFSTPLCPRPFWAQISSSAPYCACFLWYLNQTREVIVRIRNTAMRSRNLEKQYVLNITSVCLCPSLSYLSSNSHFSAPCHTVRLYSSFPQSLINSMIPGKKKLLNIKCVFWIPLHLLSEIFLRIIQRDTMKYAHRSSCKSIRSSCRILITVNFLRKIFFYKKNPNIKIMDIYPVGIE